MNEFDLIAKYFRPLSEGAAGALDLLDDAALVGVPADHELVVTADAIVGGTHFFPNDPIDTVAQKLLRVNVSDLAAKGARPFGYLLTCVWPRGTPEPTIASFAAGLAHAQALYDLKLLGGDTTTGDGPATFSITALGSVPQGRMIKRSTARAGELVFTTGTIGDAGLGLRLLKGELKHQTPAHMSYLTARYRLPEPRLAFMLSARDHISAAIDVSDGLIADARHIAVTSKCRVEIRADLVPISEAAGAIASEAGGLPFLATAGDDYEVCFTAPASARAALAAAAAASATRITEVGRVLPGEGVSRLLGSDNQPIPLPRQGYTHF